jgi:hypothetical protein
VTESAARSRLIFAVSPVCNECDDIQKNIQKFHRFVAQLTDALTIERLTSAIAAMEAKITALHPKDE